MRSRFIVSARTGSAVAAVRRPPAAAIGHDRLPGPVSGSAWPPPLYRPPALSLHPVAVTPRRLLPSGESTSPPCDRRGRRSALESHGGRRTNPRPLYESDNGMFRRPHTSASGGRPDSPRPKRLPSEIVALSWMHNKVDELRGFVRRPPWKGEVSRRGFVAISRNARLSPSSARACSRPVSTAAPRRCASSPFQSCGATASGGWKRSSAGDALSSAKLGGHMGPPTHQR